MRIKIHRYKAILGILLLVAVSSVGIKSAHALQTMPQTTTSWYVNVQATETDQNLYDWAYNTGYQLGQRDLNLAGTQLSAVILDFFQPAVQGGVYGTTGYSRFLSLNTIRLASVQFAKGYYMGTGTDTASHINIIVGTSNNGGYVNYAHGRAWSFLVQDIASDLVTYGYSGQVSSRGGNDFEPGFSTATAAYDWMSGYNSAYVSPYILYNYGAADGCPTSGSSGTAAACNGGWTQETVRYLSWGAAPAAPFPEIYSTAGGNASSWQQISLYSYLRYGSRMNILAPLSQYGACLQYGPCTGTNNTALAAWNQLWNALNSDSRTSQDLSWSADIKWRQ